MTEDFEVNDTSDESEEKLNESSKIDVQHDAFEQSRVGNRMKKDIDEFVSEAGSRKNVPTE